MKKIVLLLTVACFVLAASGQAVGDTTHTQAYYLQKSKRQKTTGWVLLTGGSAMVVAGVIIGSQEEDNPEDFGLGEHFTTGLWLFIPGAIADLASLPFFVSASNNARRAASFSFRPQQLLLPRQGGFVVRSQPALTVRIGL